MKTLRGVVSTTAFILALLLLLASAALLLSTLVDGYAIADGVNKVDAAWRAVAILAVVATAIGLISHPRTEQSAFAGTILTLTLGLLAVAIIPAGTFETPTGRRGLGADEASETEPLMERLRRAYAAADTIPEITMNANSEPYSEEIQLANAGLYVRRLVIDDDELTLQFSVNARNQDPAIAIVRLEEGESGESVVDLLSDRIIALDDDGGDGLNSYLEARLRRGSYLLDIRDYAAGGPGYQEPVFELAISFSSFEEEAARAVRGGRAALKLLGDPTIDDPISISWSGVAGVRPEPRLLEVTTSARNVCLVVDVDPVEKSGLWRNRDPKVEVKNDRLVSIASNDDFRSGEYGARIVVPTSVAPASGDEEAAKRLLVYISAMAPNTEYRAYADVRAVAEGQSCPDAGAVSLESPADQSEED